MMIDDILKKALAQLDSAEVFQIDSEITEVSFESGILKSAEKKNVSGYALRTIHEGRLGFSSTTDPSRIDDIIQQARYTSQFGKAVEYSFPAESQLPPVTTTDPSIETFGAAAMVKEGKRTVDLLSDSCPTGLANVTFATTVSTIKIANSSGLASEYRQTRFSHSVVLNVIEGDSILWIEDGGEFGALTLDTDRYTASISKLYRDAKRTAPRISKSMPVIFIAQQLPNILQTVSLGVNGLSLVKGDSPLIGREGERVLGHATITDDPLRTLAPESRPFDDEGSPSSKTVLFEDGIFRNFLFNLDTAFSAGRSTTGNASRRGLSKPDVSVSNLVISAGDSSLDEMLGSQKECILVHGVIGGGQSNLLAGDFSLNVMLGFLVQNGEIVGRLVDTMVSGNVYSAFEDIAAVGSETIQAGSLFAPDIMFGHLSVSGS